MIFTLKVTLLGGMYAESECIRTIEIDSSSTLDDLHLVILDAVGFDNDHLYEFYVSRTERSRDRRRYSSFDGYDFEDDENSDEVTLESLFPLEKSKNLYYLFDFGDSWRFRITKSRKKPTNPEKGVRYPRIVERVGDDPEQYPAFED
ncbi:IS1096 element passenger TnpR family protein [Granulosicoccus antarcticus]|nr:plasmid pRiA4b ORF-3 family protein [Granulosicoccus antarcticus]